MMIIIIYLNLIVHNLSKPIGSRFPSKQLVICYLFNIKYMQLVWLSGEISSGLLDAINYVIGIYWRAEVVLVFRQFSVMF